MDLITKSPGLLDIAERIFMELDHEKLLLCEEVNSNWRTILRNPWFWYKKCQQNSTLSVYQSEWEQFIRAMQNRNLSDHLTSILKKIHSKAISEESTIASGSVSLDHLIFEAASIGDVEFVQLLAHLSDNPNAIGHNGNTPIYQATLKNHREVVRILASLTDKPNAACENGRTPLQFAVRHGHREIVRILDPHANDFNDPGHNEEISTTQFNTILIIFVVFPLGVLLLYYLFIILMHFIAK